MGKTRLHRSGFSLAGVFATAGLLKMLDQFSALAFFISAAAVVLLMFVIPSRWVDAPFNIIADWRAGRWRPNLISIAIVIVCALGLTIGFAMMYFQHQEFQRANPKLDGLPQNTGVLKSLPISTKQASQEHSSTEILLNGVVGTLSRTLEFGDSGSGLKQVGPIQPLFKFFGTSEFMIEIVEGELKVSTKIFDENGNLIAELIRSEWKVAPNPAIWDRNYTKNALEVIGPKGRVVLQVRLVEDRVQLQGEWRGTTGKGAVLAKSNDPNNPGGLIEIVPAGKLPKNEILPIFRYPSEAHFGEYLE